jgi:hypothetical protein
MPTQIVNVCKLQTAKVMAVMYLVISLPIAFFMQVPLFFGKHEPGDGTLWLMWLIPVFYTVFGFVFTFVGAWIYNGVASKIGGIQFTVADVEGK